MKLQLLQGVVGHERLVPKHNKFRYRVWYVACPVTHATIETPRLFSFNRFNVLSMHTKDHGARDGTPWRNWIEKKVREHDLAVHPDDVVTLIAHPRLFGYVFNPISYWLIFDGHSQNLKGALCEVQNTFGGDHNYFLHKNGEHFTADDTFGAKKQLFVSPFTEVAPGRYTFTFTSSKDSFKSVINYFENDVQILNTYVGGALHDMSNMRILRTVLGNPLMTLMVVARIHWQAFKLYFKKVPERYSTRGPETNGVTTRGHLITTSEKRGERLTK